MEPVSVPEIQANAYIVSNDDNDFIRDQLIPQARRMVEVLAGRSLITQTRKQTYDFLPAAPLYLRFSPVQSVSTFTYVDTSGVTTTLATTEYDVDTLSIPGRIEEAYNKTWPASRHTTNAVNVTYLAGYGTTPSSVPIIYRRAIIILATHWYQNRTAFACGDVDASVLSGIMDLIAIEGRTLEYA